MKNENLPSQEYLLLDYARRLERHREGRRAVHVHLSRVYDPDLVLEAAGLNDLADRIALLRARFEARGLLQAGRLTLSAGHPALARRLSDLGLETANAPLQGSGRPGGSSTALLVKSFDPELAETQRIVSERVTMGDM